jgi:hypothetical protein
MQYEHGFSPTFLLLQQEGHLIRSCLATGLTELRAAHVHNKGAFYSSLFNLSVGFERLLKSIVILDHMIKHELAAPTRKQLKTYGHDIRQLYDRAVSISAERNIDVPAQGQLHEIDNELIALLSEFAQTTRYHNLDGLSFSQKKEDPLAHWNRIILLILERDVTKRQREKVLMAAIAIADSIRGVTATIMQGLDQAPISTTEALALPGLHQQAAKFAVLRMINLLSPLRDLISSLSHESYKYGGSNPIPQMQEFLEWVYPNREYVLRKRKWP